MASQLLANHQYQVLPIDDRKDLRVCMACILALCKHAYWYIWPFVNTYIYIFPKNQCIFYPRFFSTIFCKNYFVDTHVCVDALFFLLNSVNCVYQPAYSRDLIKKICYQVGLEPVSPFIGVNTAWSSVLYTAQQQRAKFNFPFAECTSSRSDLLESLYLRIFFNMILFPITPRLT